jgi:two-component system chemotaxis response regulator CheB
MRKYLCNRLGEIANFEIITIAGSLGGIAALGQIVSELPADFPVPIVIAQHLYPEGSTYLPSILNQRTKLRVKLAEENDRLQPASVYIAPPNRHLFFKSKGVLSLSVAPKVNFSRPSADVLFESVAKFYQTGAIGVVLSGKLYDGAAGAQAIKAKGGRIITQDHQSSVAFDMPQAAIQTGSVDFVLSLEKIASALISMVMVTGISTLLGGSMPLSSIIS